MRSLYNDIHKSCTSSPDIVIKNINGQYIFTHSGQLQRWDEHYKNHAFDETDYRLNINYWNSIFPNVISISWNINVPT